MKLGLAGFAGATTATTAEATTAAAAIVVVIVAAVAPRAIVLAVVLVVLFLVEIAKWVAIVAAVARRWISKPEPALLLCGRVVIVGGSWLLGRLVCVLIAKEVKIVASLRRLLWGDWLAVARSFGLARLIGSRWWVHSIETILKLAALWCFSLRARIVVIGRGRIGRAVYWVGYPIAARVIAKVIARVITNARPIGLHARQAINSAIGRIGARI